MPSIYYVATSFRETDLTWSGAAAACSHLLLWWIIHVLVLAAFISKYSSLIVQMIMTCSEEGDHRLCSKKQVNSHFRLWFLLSFRQTIMQDDLNPPWSLFGCPILRRHRFQSLMSDLRDLPSLCEPQIMNHFPSLSLQIMTCPSWRISWTSRLIRTLRRASSPKTKETPSRGSTAACNSYRPNSGLKHRTQSDPYSYSPWHGKVYTVYLKLPA